MYERFKEELRLDEYGINVFEQILLPCEKEAKNIEEEFINKLMDYGFSLDNHED